MNTANPRGAGLTSHAPHSSPTVANTAQPVAGPLSVGHPLSPPISWPTFTGFIAGGLVIGCALIGAFVYHFLNEAMKKWVVQRVLQWIEGLPWIRDGLHRTYRVLIWIKRGVRQLPWMYVSTKYNNAPALPLNFVAQPQMLMKVHQTFIDGKTLYSIAMTAIQGLPKTGKTILAQELCHDKAVGKRFPDGIIWIAVGKQPVDDLVTILREVGKAFGDDLAVYDTALGCKNRYKTIMRDKAALIILDDIWSALDIEPYRAASPLSCLLFTTRDASIALELGAQSITLDLPANTAGTSAFKNSVHVATLAISSPHPQPLTSNGAYAGHLFFGHTFLIPLSWTILGGLILALIGALIRSLVVRGGLRSIEMVESSPSIERRSPRYNNAPPSRDYIDRSDTLDALRRTLTDVNKRSSIAMTAIQGKPGIGKTSLALALCHDEAVQQRFPDGVIWISMGDETHDLVSRMREVAKAFGENLTPYDTDLGSTNRYRTIMRDKAALIVLDNLYSSRDLEAFNAASTRSHLVFTTRDESIASDTGADVITPGLLTPEQSRDMLADWSGLPTEFLPAVADDLIRECGGLALALAIVGAMLRGEPPASWQRVLNILRTTDLRMMGQGISEYPYPNVLSAVKASIDALDLKTRERYYALAVIPEDMPIHPLIQQLLWNAGKLDARETAEELVHRALAQRAGNDGSIRLHDLLLDYVRTHYPDRVALNLIHNAIRLSPQVIESDPTQFASQLVGRLLPYVSTEAIRDFIQAITHAAPRPWLRPLKPALQPPGTGLLRTLSGHADGVEAVAVTPDGRRAVSASADGTLKVWDLESGHELATIKGHGGWVNAVAVTPDGRRAVSAFADGTLKVWELEGGRELHTLFGHAKSVTAVVVTPDGRRAVSASADGTLKVWELESGYELATIKGHAGRVSAVAVTPDGAVSASADGTLKVWELETGRELRTLKGHTGRVSAVAVTPDGRRAVSASADGTLKVWELESGRELRTLEGHAGRVSAVAVSPDGRRAVSASADGTLKVWELESGRELQTLEVHASRVNAVVVTPDGQHAVSASADGTLKMWELESVPELRTTKGHAGPVSAVAVALNAQRAVSASANGTLKVWELESGRELRTIESHAGEVLAVTVTPDGRRTICASADGTLKVWELESGRELQTLSGHASRINAVAVTSDGRHAVSASADSTLKVWELESGRELRTIKGRGGEVLAVTVTPDGQCAVSALADGTLKVWEIESGAELETLKGHAGEVLAVTVTSDGRRAVSASADGTLKVWELESGRELQTLSGHFGRVNSVALMPDSQHAVSASDDGTLKVWELDSGVRIATFACDAPAQCCAIAQDRTIVAGDQSGRLYILALEISPANRRPSSLLT